MVTGCNRVANSGKTVDSPWPAILEQLGLGLGPRFPPVLWYHVEMRE